MKTNIFDFKRIGLLFQRYFTERSHTELIYWSIMAIVFMFIRNVTPLMVILIIVAGTFYAGRFFREIHSRSNGVAYFMIPATQLEKLTVGIVITSFYYFVMMIIAYIIGNLLGTFFNNMLASVDFIGLNIFHHIPLQWKLLTDSAVVFTMNQKTIDYYKLFGMSGSLILIQSIFLLGSIYFKSNQTLKTFLSIIAFYFIIAILVILEIKLIMGDFTQNYSFSLNMYNLKDNFKIISQIFYYLLIPFFWVVSYFRLTEKQV